MDGAVLCLRPGYKLCDLGFEKEMGLPWSRMRGKRRLKKKKRMSIYL